MHEDRYLHELKAVPPLLRNSFAANQEVHVWCLRTNFEERCCGQFATVLSSDERMASSKFRFAVDRIRFIISHANVRWLLAQYAEVEPETILFSVTGCGKPVVWEPAVARDLCFNLSHSGELALVAVTRKRELGADIEQMRSNVAVDQLAERFFCCSERKWLATLSQEERQKGFYRLWTAKESVLKAHGAGLTTPLGAICVRFCGNRHVQVQCDSWLGHDWFVKELQVPRGYAGAIALKGGDPATIRVIQTSGQLRSDREAITTIIN